MTTGIGGAGDPGSAPHDAGASPKPPADTVKPETGKTPVGGSGGAPASGSPVGGVGPADDVGGGVVRPGVADPGAVGSEKGAEMLEPPAADVPPVTSAEPQPPTSVEPGPELPVEPQPKLPVESQPAAVVSPTGSTVPTAPAGDGGREARHEGAAGSAAGQFGGTAAGQRDADPGDAARGPGIAAVKTDEAVAPGWPQVWPGRAPGAGWVPQDVSDMVGAPAVPSAFAERAVVSSDVVADPPNVMSMVLGVLGSSGLLDSTPAGPVDSPLLWAMLAAVRNPGGKSGIDAGVAGAGAGVATGLVVDDAVEPMAGPVSRAAGVAPPPGEVMAMAAAAAADTTAPTVSLTGPANGARVSGTVNLAATAADNAGGSGVVGVQFMVDGVAVGTEDPSSPYGVSWNTATVSNGSHTVRARARDAAGNIRTSSPVSITVDNTAPTVSVTGPANGATVSGSVNLAATASDNAGVVGVQFLVDGVAVGAEDTSSPYRVSWNTATVANGSHTVTARARDAAGNITTSAARSVTVANAVADTTAPTVSLIAPPAGPVRGSVSLAATAADNVGVVGVQFLVDGAALGAEDTSSTYGVSWNTATVTNGSHTVAARARDAAGNTTTTPAVTVTVDNAAPSVSLTRAAGRTGQGRGEPGRGRRRQCRGGRGAVPGGRQSGRRRGRKLVVWGVVEHRDGRQR